MPGPIALRRPTVPLDAVVRLPGSKSFTNRALLLAAIARGHSRLTGALDADDTRLMRACLESLGVTVRVGADATTMVVEGAGGPLHHDDAPLLDVGLAGTVGRFLTAVLAASPGCAHVDGTARMRERPMAMLIDALREQGGRIECLREEGCFPVRIGPHDGGLKGGTVTLDRPASSQFVSALVIAATLAERPTTIVLQQGTPSRPYVDMTLASLRAFGGTAEWTTGGDLHVEPSRLTACDYAIEPDASGASYFLALAAIHGGRVTVPGIGSDALQGDAQFATLLRGMGAHVEQSATSTTVTGSGVLYGGDFDLTDMPDVALTLAVAAAFASGPTSIRGVAILRHHESDRIAAIATELRKLGVEVAELDDGLVIHPPTGGLAAGVAVDSHEDHRMAMAMSLVGDIVVQRPQCVAKTYPGYFDELRNLGMVRGESV